MSAGFDDWVIAIPSYRRADTLKDKTLRVLREYDIPVERIHVFVASQEEETVYRETLEAGTYGHLHVATPGMAAVRNFITEYFPVGQFIFNLDDDIRGFIQYDKTAPRSERRVSMLYQMITYGFRQASGIGARLWGIYPVPNGFFMDEGTQTGLQYIMGGAWGIENPGPVLKVTMDDKEDYMRSVIMYLLDGTVLRYRNFACQTVGYSGKGGMQVTRSKKTIHDAAVELTKMFPELVSLNTSKRSGKTEVRLKDRRRIKVFGRASQKVIDEVGSVQSEAMVDGEI